MKVTRPIIALALVVLMHGVVSRVGASEETQPVVLNGLPSYRVTASAGEAGHSELTESERFEFRILITKRGNDYLWASRDGRRLLHSESGIFHYFIDPKGAGYVKVTSLADGVLYYEHMSLGMDTITYWGVTDALNP